MRKRLSSRKISKDFREILSCVFFCSILLFYTCHDLSAETLPAEKVFFSHKRFVLNIGLIGKVSESKGTRKELDRFTQSFTKAKELISEGRLEEAKAELFRAMKVWPEYFGTDFLLALVYEDSGNIALASRFYKSYLNKLRDFHRGKHKISETLIRVLTEGDIENYSVAYKMVEKHLAEHGIELGRVRPVAGFPVVFFYLIVLVLSIAVYLGIVYRLVPYLERRRRIKHPPEGFWVCEYCGTTTPNLSNVCNKCRRPRPRNKQGGHP